VIRLAAPHRAARDVEVAVVPMINIVFLLLLYFLLAGRLMVTEGPGVELPTGGGPRQPEPAAVAVMVDENGAFWLGTRELTEPELRQHLQALSHEASAAGVLIRADGRAESAALQIVLEACQSAGVAEIRLATIQAG
jgi:biopolymer transport protein ExbD